MPNQHYVKQNKIMGIVLNLFKAQKRSKVYTKTSLEPFSQNSHVVFELDTFYIGPILSFSNNPHFVT